MCSFVYHVMYSQLAGHIVNPLGVECIYTIYRILNAMLNYCDFPDLKQIAV